MKIKINNIAWKIIFEEKISDDNPMGLCRPSRLELHLCTKMAKEAIRTTIIHEVTHAYMFSCGFTKPYSESEMLFSEEQLCDFLAMNIENILSISNYIWDVYLKSLQKK